MEDKVKLLERQIFLLQESEKKMMGQLQNTISYTQVNALKKQLVNEKGEKQLMSQ